MPAIVTFDPSGPLRIIEIDTGGDNSLTWQEIYSEWKVWAATGDNAKYSPAFAEVGGNPTIAPDALGVTMYLLKPWRIRPAERSHRLKIDGNCYLGVLNESGEPSGVAESPVAPTLGTYTVLVETKVSNLTDSRLLDPGGLCDEVATAVWEEPIANHTAAGTYGAEVATKADINAAAATDLTVAVGGAIITGTLVSGSYLSTQVRDGTYYWRVQEVAGVGGGLSVEMTFRLPSAQHRAGAFFVFGRYIGTPATFHYLDLFAYNYSAAAWEQLQEQFMPGGNASDIEAQHEFYERHVDRTNNNEVKIRLVHNVTTYNSGHSLYLDLCQVSGIRVVTAADIADAVWDELQAGHTTPGSYAEIAVQIATIHAIEAGRWKIDTSAKTLTYYEADLVTPIIVFNLFDSAGTPSSENVFERVPV